MRMSMTTLAVAAALPTGHGFAETIYENVTTGLGSTSFTALQIGDEVHAAGTDRAVTELQIGVTQQGFAGTGDFQARLYANDGPGGQPGTLLWESAVMDDVALSGDAELLTFAVPGVEVPDTFTWTILISDTSPVAVGLPHFDPPSVGTSPDFAWFGSPGSWTQLAAGAAPANFMARIVAGGCAGDLDGSGNVGFSDLLLVISAWGRCPEGAGATGCPGDLDGSGDVGFGDLLVVLSAWGDCR